MDSYQSSQKIIKVCYKNSEWKELLCNLPIPCYFLNPYKIILCFCSLPLYHAAFINMLHNLLVSFGFCLLSDIWPIRATQHRLQNEIQFLSTKLLPCRNLYSNLSCCNKVLIIMNCQAKNVIIMPTVESLLMSFGAVNYTQCSSVKNNFITLSIEYVVAGIIAMIPVDIYSTALRFSKYLSGK